MCSYPVIINAQCFSVSEEFWILMLYDSLLQPDALWSYLNKRLNMLLCNWYKYFLYRRAESWFCYHFTYSNLWPFAAFGNRSCLLWFLVISIYSASEGLSRSVLIKILANKVKASVECICCLSLLNFWIWTVVGSGIVIDLEYYSPVKLFMDWILNEAISEI